MEEMMNGSLFLNITDFFSLLTCRNGRHMAEFEQRKLLLRPLPTAMQALLDEKGMLQKIANPIQAIRDRITQIDEKMDRLTIAAEPKNGVWLTGPKGVRRTT